MDESIQEEIGKLEPSTVMTFYELVLKGYNASYYFHSGENGLSNSITFKGKEYYYVPIKANGFDATDSSLPRPTLSIDNHDSFFSLKTKFFKDFVGFTLKRTRTFVKFLHGENFPNNLNPFGTPTEVSFPTEKYIINKKIIENQDAIQFELASVLEKENAFLPSRKIVFNTCQWRYRHHIGCGYSEGPVSDSKGNPIDFYDEEGINIYNEDTTYSRGQGVLVPATPGSQDVDKVFVCLVDDTQGKNPLTDKTAWVMDSCPKNISGCRSRFANEESTNGLPFGGFPGSWGQ
jgi:lambda family phage minor tail protein L